MANNFHLDWPKEGLSHLSGTMPDNDIDNLVKTNTREIFRNSGLFRRLTIILSIALVALVLSFAILFYCHEDIFPHTKACETKECLQAASYLRSSMDLRANPCEDFYRYACGHWAEEHANFGWYPSFTVGELMAQTLAQSAKDFLQKNGSDDDPLPVKNSRLLYQSCLDTDTLTHLGYSVMFKYLTEANLPVAPTIFKGDDQKNFRFDWMEADVTLKKLFDMDVFLGFNVSPDVFNSSRYAMWLGVPSATSSLPNLVKILKDLQEMVRTFNGTDGSIDLEEKLDEITKSTIAHVLKSVVANATTLPEAKLLDKATNVIYHFSKEIEEMADITPSKKYFNLTVTRLQELTNEYLTNQSLPVKDVWQRYLQLTFSDIPGVNITDEDVIYTTQPDLEYVLDFIGTIVQTEPVVIELYSWWMAVQAMVLSTTTEMQQFISKELTIMGRPPIANFRSLKCTDLTIQFMGMAVTYGLVDEDFLKFTKPKVEQLLRNIKVAFSERVEEIDWMDQETKNATLKKMEKIGAFIGFPEWLFNRTALEGHYSNVTFRNNSMLGNLMESVKRYFPDTLGRLRKEYRKTWIVEPTTIDAFYYSGLNSMFIPWGTLLFPLYHLGLESLHYGTLAAIVGHELVHAFDTNGRLYDQNGNMNQWWSHSTIDTFLNESECFVKQYNNFTVFGKAKVDGVSTLSENIADNGGLNLAFSALKKFVKDEGKLPGFGNFTSEQLFFIAYGTVSNSSETEWCNDLTKWSIFDKMKDAHSPSKVRLEATLQNSEDFASVFGCPVGSRMNPDKPKCRIW